MLMGQHAWEQQTGMEWHSWRRDGAKKRPILNLLALAADVVWSCWKVGGRWSAETRSFLSQLAAAKAREEVPLLQKRAEQAWRWRWASILSCAAARAVAESLLGLKGPGADGLVPAIDDVIADCRYADGAAA